MYTVVVAVSLTNKLTTLLSVLEWLLNWIGCVGAGALSGQSIEKYSVWFFYSPLRKHITTVSATAMVKTAMLQPPYSSHVQVESELPANDSNDSRMYYIVMFLQIYIYIYKHIQDCAKVSSTLFLFLQILLYMFMNSALLIQDKRKKNILDFQTLLIQKIFSIWTTFVCQWRKQHVRDKNMMKFWVLLQNKQQVWEWKCPEALRRILHDVQHNLQLISL